MKAIRYTEEGTDPSWRFRYNCIYVPGRRAVYFVDDGRIVSVARVRDKSKMFESDHIIFGKNAESYLKEGRTEYIFGDIFVSEIKPIRITKSKLEELIKAEQKAKEERNKKDSRRLVAA